VKRRRLLHQLLTATAATLVSLIVASAPAYAVANLSDVIDSVQRWVAGLLLGLATLFFTVGAIRYQTAAGNRRDTERGKEAMKSALVGYVLAGLSPLLIGILRQIMGI
jgi:putative Mn2+ efflux pump MntP